MFKTLYSIQIKAIVTRSTATQDLRHQFTPDDILDLLQTVNQIYQPTGLQFTCDRASVEYEPDPIFNQETSKSLWQHRAAQHPNKLVLFFTDGDAGAPPTVRNYAYIWQATGFDHARQLAHEVGHYFHLDHTFTDLPLTVVIEQVQERLLSRSASSDALLEEAGILLNQLLDGDRTTVEDTPATLHDFSAPSLPIQLHLDPEHTYTYHFKPDLNNLMSYAQGATQLSTGQIQRMHQALMSDRKLLLV